MNAECRGSVSVQQRPAAVAKEAGPEQIRIACGADRCPVKQGFFSTTRAAQDAVDRCSVKRVQPRR